MLKTLIKKQFSELFSIYFQRGSSKKKKKSSGSKTGIAILIALIVLVSMFAFYGMAELLGSVMYNTANCWLFFDIFAGLAVVIAAFVNIFISSSMLYKAKDNSLLLSLPIKPKTILLSRMSVLYFNCTIFTTIIWLPISINYFVHVSAGIVSVVNIILLLFILPLSALIISCILGFLVSLISMKRGITRVLGLFGVAILVVAFIAIRVNINSSLNAITDNVDQISATAKGWVYPAQAAGLAACGDVLAMLFVVGITLIVFALLYLLMLKTFINLITSSKGGKKAVYKEKEGKRRSVGAALLIKEFRLFWGTPTYMINCGLGVAIMIIGIIAAIWQAGTLKQFAPLFQAVPEFGNALPICLVSLIGFVIGLDVISTPSVSVEGRKNIWILQSLPIDPYQPLKAKTLLHFIVNSVPAVLLAIVICIILEINVLISILLCITLLSFILLTGIFGTFISVRRANLDWINIVIPVKQNIGILFSILFTFGLSIAICIPGIFVVPYAYLPVISVVMLLFCLLINKWLKNTGAKRFSNL
ncbi:MAG: hypothetical protein Q4E88_02090 [Coriobacteriia bacterium]|nr:hypothetical protein [Coriobacteriia bacterium]